MPAVLWKKSASFLPQGKLHSPYGATEALPVSTISADDVATLAGSSPGAPVGRPLPGIEARIIAVADGPIVTWAEARELPPGEIGEIVVRGPVVTREYDGLGAATALAKIQDGASVWHRMGDCGYLDPAGLLWFCGRKAERVQTEAGTLQTEICEQVFRSHPRAARCALIGLGRPGRQVPAPRSRDRGPGRRPPLGRRPAPARARASGHGSHPPVLFPAEVSGGRAPQRQDPPPDPRPLGLRAPGVTTHEPRLLARPRHRRTGFLGRRLVERLPGPGPAGGPCSAAPPRPNLRRGACASSAPHSMMLGR